MPAGLRIALAGGGTGGHVVPGLHVLEQLSRRGTELADVLWLGAGRAIEERALIQLEREGRVPFEKVALALEPPGAGAPSWARLALRTLPETARAGAALERHQSRVLLALGGYTCVPAVLGARSQGIPVVLLEINAVRGKATRSLAPLATRVVHAWPSSCGRPGRRHVVLGPPLAAAFQAGEPDALESARARERLGFDPARALLLVLGGSQGALALNRFVQEHAPALLRGGLQVLHQVGPGRLGEAARSAEGYRALEYVDDVATALAAATLVLCRGGASTLAEIAARARPAWVVPYPHGDRHQARNAAALGAGVRIVPEETLGRALVQELVELGGPAGTERRAAMARALASAVPKDGAERLCAELVAIAAEAPP